MRRRSRSSSGVLGGNLLLCAFDDGRLEAEPRRDGEGVGLAGNAGQQAVGRLKRLDVELAGGVFHAVRRERKGL